jgi:hypothetical protein
MAAASWSDMRWYGAAWTVSIAPVLLGELLSSIERCEETIEPVERGRKAQMLMVEDFGLITRREGLRRSQRIHASTHPPNVVACETWGEETAEFHRHSPAQHLHQSTSNSSSHSWDYHLFVCNY